MTEKYEMTGETKEHEGRVLHRIRALRDIPAREVKKGDLGGWVESEHNLAQSGDCWIGEEAKVYENGRVAENAFVYGAAQVSGGANVYGSADVSDEAHVCGRGDVCGDAAVYDNARVSGDARVFGHVHVWGDARVEGDAYVTGEASIMSRALVRDKRDYIVVSDGLMVADGTMNSPLTVYRTVDGTLMWAVDTYAMTGDQLVDWIKHAATADVAARVALYVTMCEKAI